MHRRKGGKQQREAASGSGTNAGDQGKPPQPATADSPAPTHTAPAADGKEGKRKADAAPQAAPPAVSEPAGSAAADALSALLALVLLLFSNHAAVRLLAPQTGSWLARSFCSLVLFALAAVGAVAGHVAEEGAATLAALRAGSTEPTAADSSPAAAPLGIAARSWWAAAAAAAALAAPALPRLAGRLLLAPGLADDSSLRISDAELTLRAMALAAALAGPLFLSLGAAAGAAGGRALRRWAGPAARPQLMLLLLVAAAATAGLGWGLPAALVPPRPASALLPAIVGVALLAAAALTPQPARSKVPTAGVSAAATSNRGKKPRKAPGRTSVGGSAGDSSRRWQRALAAVLAAAALAVAAQRARTPQCSSAPSGTPVQLEGGRYSSVVQCETAGGGRLGVIEGTYKGQYRYRLLRMDHSVLGGEYIAPADVAGQPIYTAFYLQQAAVLLNPNGTRSLHVGLGVGTAVKGMQRMGITADSLELVPEVLAAAQGFFALQPSLGGGRALVGDALREVPALAASHAGRYDYVLHDVFSGGGTAAPLMGTPFFRQLSRLLAPAGVVAVNYYGGKGPGLKETWCRLRLAFDHVRAFADVEKSRVRNHVLFAAHFDLGAANLTAAVGAAAARQAAAEAAGTAEVFDPLQLRLWRALGRQEVQLTYDRQRCLAMLRASDGAARGRAGQTWSKAADGDSWHGEPGVGGAAAEMMRQRQRQQAQGRQREAQQQTGGRQHSPPWAWRQLKALRERHALAVTHFVAMRTQFADSLWLS
ncbi:hypothetical protein ABPG75_007057 [Micractinium tetrahymenae]